MTLLPYPLAHCEKLRRYRKLATSSLVNGHKRALICFSIVSCTSPMRIFHSSPAINDPSIDRRCCMPTAYGINRNAKGSEAAIPNHHIPPDSYEITDSE